MPLDHYLHKEFSPTPKSVFIQARASKSQTVSDLDSDQDSESDRASTSINLPGATRNDPKPPPPIAERFPGDPVPGQVMRGEGRCFPNDDLRGTTAPTQKGETSGRDARSGDISGGGLYLEPANDADAHRNTEPPIASGKPAKTGPPQRAI